MNYSQFKPMGVGSLLDRSFSLYRHHFVQFFLLTLLLLGPCLLMQEVLMTDLDSVPLVKSDEESSTFWEIWQNRLVEPDPALNDNVGDNVGLLLLNLLVIVPLTLLFAYPLTLSATLLMTRAGVTGETISMKAALKQALSRVWPLAGSTFVFGLFISGILVILTVLFMVVGISIVGMATVDDSDLSPLALIGWLIGGYIALIITVVLVSSFFVIRWGFYLPVVLLDHEGLGIGRSWKITKGNFWRLAALYLVMTVIYTIFSGGISALSLVVFGTSILSKLIQVLVSCLLMPWMMIVYALSYLDLKLRYEGTDVEALLKRQAAASAAAELNGSHD
ncbi:GPDPase-memb domain-containing protein [Brevibacillus aydinogluensis]|jgi:membrane-anchored glycerophosphoryl diester phosphodiesterase (GDPDase)|uniref:GPDPase-memb domain-containing protein n=2 Tax=Brevibacillus aydinogluensis TaxID=927786 RepID=A0AA48M8X1_9BACL|nr:GPDPase-memb domain-containing protein [Brevibacillus aydinogluensis]